MTRLRHWNTGDALLALMSLFSFIGSVLKKKKLKISPLGSQYSKIKNEIIDACPVTTVKALLI